MVLKKRAKSWFAILCWDSPSRASMPPILLIARTCRNPGEKKRKIKSGGHTGGQCFI